MRPRAVRRFSFCNAPSVSRFFHREDGRTGGRDRGEYLGCRSVRCRRVTAQSPFDIERLEPERPPEPPVKKSGSVHRAGPVLYVARPPSWTARDKAYPARTLGFVRPPSLEHASALACELDRRRPHLGTIRSRSKKKDGLGRLGEAERPPRCGLERSRGAPVHPRQRNPAAISQIFG